MDLVKQYFKDERKELKDMSPEDKAELAEELRATTTEVKAIEQAAPFMADKNESDGFRMAVGLAMHNPKIAKAMKAMKLKLSSKQIPEPFDVEEEGIGPWIQAVVKYVETEQTSRTAATKKLAASRRGR